MNISSVDGSDPTTDQRPSPRPDQVRHGVSVGQLPNFLNGRRRTDEGRRRLVARKIGLPDEVMIGLTPQFNSPSCYNFIVPLFRGAIILG